MVWKISANMKCGWECEDCSCVQEYGCEYESEQECVMSFM